MNMNTDTTFAEMLTWLSMAEIQQTLPHRTFTRSAKRSRAALTAAVTQFPGEDQVALQEAARAKKRRRIGEEREKEPDVQNETDAADAGFFETVTEEVRRERIVKFIDATGNDALATEICAVCAGRFFTQSMNDMLLSKLRVEKTLVPSQSHPAHVLMEEMLLHNTGDSIRTDANGERYAHTCATCTSSLQKKKTPPLALANGMWIGNVPLVLKILTLPERILVARYFPAAYIVKLYPKKKGARMWGEGSGLHSGLQGNVSTYHLNTSDVASMITEKRTMPPPSSILAATVGVTFVGPRNLPEKTLPGFLRVNRMRVRNALEWLKQNNPLYADIEISTERLNELPSDGFPKEISTLTRHLTDEMLLADETDGCVPEEGDGEENAGERHCDRCLGHHELNFFWGGVECAGPSAGVFGIDEYEGEGDERVYSEQGNVTRRKRGICL